MDAEYQKGKGNWKERVSSINVDWTTLRKPNGKFKPDLGLSG